MPLSFIFAFLCQAIHRERKGEGRGRKEKEGGQKSLESTKGILGFFGKMKRILEHKRSYLNLSILHIWIFLNLF